MKRREFLLSAGASALAMPALMRKGWAQEAEYELTLHTFLSQQAPSTAEMLAPWAKSIEDNSGGRVRIEIFPSMTLGGAPPQLFRQVVDGVVDIVWTANGYTPGLFPRSEVFELPNVFGGDITAANLAMRALHDEWLAEDYKDVHLLFNHVHAGNALHMANTPVRTPEDVVGKKLRVPSPVGQSVIEALGATPVNMPVPDLPQSLSTNAVAGALIPFEIIPPLQLQEVTKYQIEGPEQQRFGTLAFQTSMNLQRWESLPEDIQQIITKATDEAFLRQTAQVWRDAEQAGLDLAAKAGNEHIVIEPDQWAAFEEKLFTVVENWTQAQSGFDAAALVEAARASLSENAS